MVLQAENARSTLAYVFPGQGSQSPGMGQELFETSPAARAVFQEADDFLGYSLSKLCFEGPDDRLRQTVHAQPALLTTSVATLAALAEAHGERSLPQARFVAGHSVGEYAALVASGTVSFQDALRLVQERGRLMHHAGQVQEGSMAAVLGLDLTSIEQLCQQTGAEIANINCEGQVVISGSKQALVAAIDLARALGAKRAIPLVVSGAFHSSLMRPAVPGMAAALGNTSFADPRVPVISNLTAEPLYQAKAFHQELIDQICSCVHWSESVDYMAKNGVNTFVEIGPGKVLTGLIKRIAKDAQTISIADVASVRSFAA